MKDALQKDTPKTLLVTGANGFIGSRLAALAVGRGYSVNTLTRSNWSGAPHIPEAQRYFGALPDQIPAEALHGVAAVIHCAASFETDERRATAANVEGTLRLAGLARDCGVSTFIFLSSQSARPDAVSVYGKTKYAAERGLLEEEKLDVIILRPGLVTGPGERGLFSRTRQMVEKLPLLPLLGGGKSIVQPIHVDDLCEAILRCIERSAELKGRILNLGDPKGLPLRDFLQTIAKVRLGKRRRSLNIPIQPVQLAVHVAETIGLRLPINTSNLKGLKLVERMETEGDLAALNLQLRPLEEMVGDPESSADDSSPDEVKMLLVGAGRIGIVHALTLWRLAGVDLAGIVDPNAKARGLLQGMGLPVRMFDSLDEALATAKPEAVVVATPPSTHLDLARMLVQRQLAIMIEKPLAVERAQLSEYQSLQAEFPAAPIQVGYVMPCNPQVEMLLSQLRAGQFGKVRRFIGITLLSLIHEGDTKRWEVIKSKSGGGVLINSGGHVLSMIHAAFGQPQSISGEHLRLHSVEVEDSMVLKFTYPEFEGTQYCSWSIRGYPRQENKLIIETEKGRVILTGTVGIFVEDTGFVDITHQLDFNVGFNLAPDYVGAGFTTELNDLKNAVRGNWSPHVDLGRAIEIEECLFTAYENSREVKEFAKSEVGGSQPVAVADGSSNHANAIDVTEVRRVLDLRELSPEDVRNYFARAAERADWNEYLITPNFFGKLPPLLGHDRLRVTVPDFLNQSRLISAARYGEVLRQMGVGGIAVAARIAIPALMKERAVSFWVAAMGLLGAGLQAVPGNFRGTILLHVYLTDLALTLRRLDVLKRMLATCRRLRPHARIGFHTNLAAEALQALPAVDEPLDEVSFLSSPNALQMSEILSGIRRSDATGKLRLTAEVGLAPEVVHREAFDAPLFWTHGADSLLLGTGAEEALAEQRRHKLEQEWRRVFPALELPEGVL